jgi:hypothetical protein
MLVELMIGLSFHQHFVPNGTNVFLSTLFSTNILPLTGQRRDRLPVEFPIGYGSDAVRPSSQLA